jgi:hypothetical protein
LVERKKPTIIKLKPTPIFAAALREDIPGILDPAK